MIKVGNFEQDRRPAEDLWRRTLSMIHSVFGRMEYLARIRNPHSGRYEHYGLAAVFSEVEADRAMRESHVQVFQEWLALDLERQKADLDLFLAEQPTDRRTMVETWRRLAPYRGLPPISASPPEIQLYLGDLELLLDVIRNECGDAAPGQTGWPLRSPGQ
ncbi:MAG: hypothetical protein IPP47_16755 [Bryobacterales bacterium]|nr:hypothetical protein [Bryobacterales bacterium]